jgi:TrmH family RNA methyltransferase
MPLTSPRNPQLQKIRRAVETGRPLEDGTIAAEGPHLLEEALGGNWQVEQIFCSPPARQRHAALVLKASRRRIEMTDVTEQAFESLSDTEQNQGFLALLRPPEFTWTNLLKSPGPLVILDGIQDPGNAGTIVRSCEAFGASGIAFTQGCVRISNGKLLRAAAGSLFRLPFLENLPVSEILKQAEMSKRPLFSLAANGRASLLETDLRRPFMLAVGSEARGVSEALLKASLSLSIPTHGVESLNAAVACSVALFEARRQSS